MSFINPDRELLNRYSETVKRSLLKLKKVFLPRHGFENWTSLLKFHELSSRSKALDESDCPSPKFNVSL